LGEDVVELWKAIKDAARQEVSKVNEANEANQGQL
jgi:hypothetical protein